MVIFSSYKTLIGSLIDALRNKIHEPHQCKDLREGRGSILRFWINFEHESSNSSQDGTPLMMGLFFRHIGWLASGLERM